jgi:hypothetical protein
MADETSVVFSRFAGSAASDARQKRGALAAEHGSAAAQPRAKSEASHDRGSVEDDVPSGDDAADHAAEGAGRGRFVTPARAL